jgi:hypothetical protein
MELVNYQLNSNEWYVRQARMILQERGGNAKVNEALKQILTKNPDATRKLRALWTLHAIKGLSESDLTDLFSNENEYVRGWAIQLLAEDKNVSDNALTKLGILSKTENSALVRLYLAAALQRISPEMRWNMLENLVQKSEDKTDHNLPLMLWYAAEPMAVVDVDRAIKLAEKAKMPKLLNYMIQRIGAIKTPEANKALLDLKQRLGTSHDNHENMMLIDGLVSK